MLHMNITDGNIVNIYLFIHWQLQDLRLYLSHTQNYCTAKCLYNCQ